jgi:hypothetical protein
VLALLTGGPAVAVDDVLLLAAETADPLADDDLQLALACCYELHYRGIRGVDDTWEWDPSLLAVRAVLDDRFETALRELVLPSPPSAAPVWTDLKALVDSDDGPPLSLHVARWATLDQVRDLLVQRSVYHLREADSHTFAIPRLVGRAKAALVEIQADEYGNGDVDRMHASLFAHTLRAVGLCDTYGAHWDQATAQTLATVNAMSMLGLHRRHRGALAGHLAALEMTSTEPNRNYGNGLRRLGFGSDATRFFDEHVEADAVHEQLAAVDLCGSLVAAEPELRSDVLWGAGCCLALDAAAGRALLDRWSEAELGVGA